MSLANSDDDHRHSFHIKPEETGDEGEGSSSSNSLQFLHTFSTAGGSAEVGLL
jgi:hypothetical protein